MEDGLNLDDLTDLGFSAEDPPAGLPYDLDGEEWFCAGPVRVTVRPGGMTEVHLFGDAARQSHCALVHIDGAMPSVVYRAIVVSVMAAAVLDADGTAGAVLPAGAPARVRRTAAIAPGAPASHHARPGTPDGHDGGPGQSPGARRHPSGRPRPGPGGPGTEAEL